MALYQVSENELFQRGHVIPHFTTVMAILALVINTNPIGESPRNLMEAFLKSENEVILTCDVINVGKITIFSIFHPK